MLFSHAQRSRQILSSLCILFYFPKVCILSQWVGPMGLAGCLVLWRCVELIIGKSLNLNRNNSWFMNYQLDLFLGHMRISVVTYPARFCPPRPLRRSRRRWLRGRRICVHGRKRCVPFVSLLYQAASRITGRPVTLLLFWFCCSADFPISQFVQFGQSKIWQHWHSMEHKSISAKFHLWADSLPCTIVVLRSWWIASEWLGKS